MSSPTEFAARFDVSRETVEALEAYVALLRKWNPRINLVAKSSLADVWTRHIIDSAQAFDIAVSQFKSPPNSWIDLGSGGGFPGLVCAILARKHWPTAFHLVESDQRKCAFLATVAREVDLELQIHTARIEDLRPAEHDVVTARALAPLAQLLSLSASLRAKSGLSLFLKGAQAQRELTAAEKSWHMMARLIPSITAPDASVILIKEFSHA